MVNRSFWKGMYFTKKKLQTEITGLNIKKTFSKNIFLCPKLLNSQIEVYNGKCFTKIIINKNMLGYKIGEFIKTKKEFFFKKKKNGSKH